MDNCWDRGNYRERIYAKIMQHLERRTGVGFWDYRTLRLSHPQLAEMVFEILRFMLATSDYEAYAIVNRGYLPRRIWNGQQ